jgi:hypothetical protein
MQNQLQVERLRQTSSTKSIRPDLETSRNKKLSILPIFFLFLCHSLLLRNAPAYCHCWCWCNKIDKWNFLIQQININFLQFTRYFFLRNTSHFSSRLINYKKPDVAIEQYAWSDKYLVNFLKSKTKKRNFFVSDLN